MLVNAFTGGKGRKNQEERKRWRPEGRQRKLPTGLTGSTVRAEEEKQRRTGTDAWKSEELNSIRPSKKAGVPVEPLANKTSGSDDKGGNSWCKMPSACG